MADPTEMTPGEIRGERSSRDESTPPAASTTSVRPASGGDAARESMPALPTDAMIILPMRNTVLFPGMVLPLSVGRERSVAAAQEAVREQRPLGLLLQRDTETVEPGPGDLYETG